MTEPKEDLEVQVPKEPMPDIEKLVPKKVSRRVQKKLHKKAQKELEKLSKEKQKEEAIKREKESCKFLVDIPCIYVTLKSLPKTQVKEYRCKDKNDRPCNAYCRDICLPHVITKYQTMNFFSLFDVMSKQLTQITHLLQLIGKGRLPQAPMLGERKHPMAQPGRLREVPDTPPKLNPEDIDPVRKMAQDLGLNERDEPDKKAKKSPNTKIPDKG